MAARFIRYMVPRLTKCTTGVNEMHGRNAVVATTISVLVLMLASASSSCADDILARDKLRLSSWMDTAFAPGANEVETPDAEKLDHLNILHQRLISFQSPNAAAQTSVFGQGHEGGPLGSQSGGKIIQSKYLRRFAR